MAGGPSSHAQSVLGYEARLESCVGTKQQILKAIEKLPDGAGVEDALDCLCLLYKTDETLSELH